MTDHPEGGTRLAGYAIECPENCATRLRAKQLERELAACEARAYEAAAKVASDPELYKHYVNGPLALSDGIAKAIRSLSAVRTTEGDFFE